MLSARLRWPNRLPACARDRHGPAIGFVEPGRAGQQRGLAAARRPHQRDGLAPADRERGAAQGPDFRAGTVVDAEKVRDVEDGGAHLHRNESAMSFHWSALSAPAGAESVRIASLPAPPIRKRSFSSRIRLSVTEFGSELDV